MAKLADWWRRLWRAKAPNGAYLRPSTKAQKLRPLGLDPKVLARELDRVLAHHLGRIRRVDGKRVKVLVGLYRGATSFSRTDALSIARKARADGHDVDRVLRELEEDGSIECLGPDVFAFVAYNRARSNAA